VPGALNNLHGTVGWHSHLNTRPRGQTSKDLQAVPHRTGQINGLRCTTGPPVKGSNSLGLWNLWFPHRPHASKLSPVG